MTAVWFRMQLSLEFTGAPTDTSTGTWTVPLLS